MSDSTIIYTNSFDITKSNSITIQISNFKGRDLLNIYKSSFSDKYTGIVKNNSIAFTYEQALELLEIVQNIGCDYELTEYGNVGKYKVFISNFNGNNNFQIREWVESDTYTGYGKKGVSISVDKLEDLKKSLDNVINKFGEYLKNGSIESDSDNGYDIWINGDNS